MVTSVEELTSILNNSFIKRYPKEAANYLEGVDRHDAAKILTDQPITLLKNIWFYLNPTNKEAIFLSLPDEKAVALLSQMDISAAATLLLRLKKKKQAYFLSKLQPSYAKLIQEHMEYPDNVAGHLMEEVTHAYHDTMTVSETLKQIKNAKLTPSLYLYLIDNDMKLKGRVNIQKLLTADDEQPLASLAVTNTAYLSALAPKSEIAETFEKSKLDALPVLDAQGHMIGILYAAKLIQTIKEDATTDIQTMVGASAEERALSPSFFAVRKRLPWLLINLLTAFLAAFVVGLFEGLIARYTALAVLLPVVAGQSGNAGAQALAVTMRGLALREVTIAHWMKVVLKEVATGIASGLTIAVVCAIAVYFWSQSMGIAFVLALSMVFSVAIACISGAMVPMLLKRLGQDPAQSSSIILTTVTDVTGFFSFLGIATLLSKFL